MSKRILLATTAIAGSLLFTGCATLFSGKTQQINVSSVPEGAIIKINGSQVGVTPYLAQVNKQKDAVMTIEKDGYSPQTISMGTETEGFFYMNILGSYSSSTSSGIDYVNGSHLRYSPSNYHIELKQK